MRAPGRQDVAPQQGLVAVGAARAGAGVQFQVLIGQRRHRDGRADAHLARLLDGTVARGAGIQANRTRAVVPHMFSWALEREMVDRNPATGLPAPVKEGGRQGKMLPTSAP